jgi:hypothetical protein
MVVIIVVIVVVAASALSIQLYHDLNPAPTPPNSIGFKSGTVTTISCVPTHDSSSVIYRENVSISSVNGTITTDMFGLRVIAGSLPWGPINPPSGGSCPPYEGWWVVLQSSVGAPYACWTGTSDGNWSITAAACGTTTNLTPPGGLPVTLASGMSISVYTYGRGDPHQGAFTLQTYGISGATVNSEVLL